MSYGSHVPGIGFHYIFISHYFSTKVFCVHTLDSIFVAFVLIDPVAFSFFWFFFSFWCGCRLWVHPECLCESHLCISREKSVRDTVNECLPRVNLITRFNHHPFKPQTGALRIYTLTLIHLIWLHCYRMTRVISAYFNMVAESLC